MARKGRIKAMAREGERHCHQVSNAVPDPMEKDPIPWYPANCV